MKKYILVFLLIIIYTNNVKAQNNVIYNSNISSLQVMCGGDWQSLPVKNIYGNEPIRIDFDELSHEYKRYSYKIEHCEADWSISKNLFESDYIEGFAEGNIIENAEQSINTNVLYTHYSINIPNAKCKIIASGNYVLTVYDDNSGEKILKACFMVVEPIMNIGLNVITNTDIDINSQHQQVEMLLKYNDISVTNPNQQITTVLLQNNDWQSAIVNAKPQYTTPNSLKWEHCKDFIFQAGNEYRKFETLSTTNTTMGIDFLDWDGDNYNAHLFVDEPRFSYVYDVDANGSYIIRNSNNIKINTETDYIYVHFYLKHDKIDKKISIKGNWTTAQPNRDYVMEYNEEMQLYHTTIPLKQGYYSYKYITTNDNNENINLPSEGNFYQTENKYSALVYYKSNIDRTYRLVGYSQIKTR